MSDEQQVIGNWGFGLQVDGETIAFFLRISGLGACINVHEYREGGRPGNVRKIPGRAEVHDVTLEHGVANSARLWQWLDQAMKGNVERRNVSIISYDSRHQEAARWNLSGVWPRESRVKDFDALGNEALVECMTLVAETLEYQPSAGAA
ncbi:MAG: phage tail protein [Pseudomonadota bacterium]